MNTNLPDASRASKMPRRSASAAVVSVALLLFAFPDTSMAQSYTVTGTLPGAGARVTDFISTPDHFFLRVIGGQWPSTVGDYPGNVGAEQSGQITFGRPGQGGFWSGRADLAGFTRFHYDGLVTSFSAHHLTPGNGPDYFDSLTYDGNSRPGPPSFYWRPMEHGSDMDRFRATVAITVEYPHEFVLDFQSYIWTLEAFHESTGNAAAPEPGTLALLGVGLGVVGMAARRRIRYGFSAPFQASKAQEDLVKRSPVT